MTSAKKDVLEELKEHHLTRVHGRKPTAQDVEVWEEEAAEIATLIKTSSIQGGLVNGHLAIVIPQDEYRSEIEDEDWSYNEPTDPGSYNPDILGDEEEHIIKRMEAEHKQRIVDYHKYLGVTEHLRREFLASIDAPWIVELKRPRGGYANVTVKDFLKHLRDQVAKLTSRERTAMKKEIEQEWDLTNDITEYFTKMQEALAKNERWGNEISTKEMVDSAVIQMIDSGVFGHDFLRKWEMMEDVEKTWEATKQYFTEEYRSLQQYGGAKPGVLESANQMGDATELFEEFKRDSMANSEQIQQMATSFKGATDTMSEVIERLKTAMEENKVLTKTITTLTNTNKQLVESNKQLAEALTAIGGKKPATPTAATGTETKTGEGGGWKRQPTPSNPNGEKCPVCNFPHAKPFKNWCWEIEANKDKRPAEWKSNINN